MFRRGGIVRRREDGVPADFAGTPFADAVRKSGAERAELHGDDDALPRPLHGRLRLHSARHGRREPLHRGLRRAREA